MHRRVRGTEERSAAGSRFPVVLILASAVVLASALIGGTAPSDASPLDYQGLAFHDGTAPAAGPAQLASTSLLANSGPIRHRRPHRRYRTYDRDDRDPTGYFMLGAGNFDPEEQPGDGLFLNAELGGQVADPLDLGIRLAWYHREVGGSEIISTYEDPAGNTVERVVATDDVETNLVPLMALLRVRFPVASSFQPYVGGGVGWEWLTVEGTDASSGFAFQDDYDGFGAQLFAGLNAMVSSSIGLYGEALWNKSTVSAEFFDPSFGGEVREEIDVDGFGVHGGLRFRF